MEARSFRGMGVSPGLAIGSVHLVDRRRVKVPRYHVSSSGRGREKARFQRAVDSASLQIRELRERADESGLAQVVLLLSAHEMILQDDELVSTTKARIDEDGLNAEWALKKTLRDLKRLFDRLEQNFFKERRSDIDIVGDRLLRILVGERTDPLDEMPEGAVVVAHDLSPGDTVALARKKVLAFVTETGGRTSHTAIMARALNVPSVLGVPGLLEHAGSGDPIIVDGRTGEVVLDPADAVLGRYRGMQRRRQEEAKALLADRDLPSVTLDGTAIRLLGNVEVSQEIDLVLSHGGEGVGLYRTEFLRLEQGELTDHVDHFEVYRRMAQELSGRPFTIRTFDIGGDKALSDDASTPPLGARLDEAESNPALGLRGIRLSLRDRPQFREQLKGILLASAMGPVRLLVPLVSGVEEVREVREEIALVQDDLSAEGRDFDKEIAVGVMIETPAAALLADVLANECDFFAIGTNDLIQYTLATDRGNDEVAYLYRPAHPALIRLIAHVVEAAKPRGLEVSVCGEMAADPFFMPLLLGLGVRSLSMNPTSIPVVKRLVRRLSLGHCAQFVLEAKRLSTSDAVEQALAERLKAWAPDLLGGGGPHEL